MNLVLPFDTDDREFTRGVETGMLWNELQATPEPVQCTIHATNVEMAIRIGEATGRSFTADSAGDDFLHVTYGPTP